ncbi:MAG TPA: efflux RND transporter periplasmic adaptor subunit [Terriglobales bacterium]|jgi:cobalt-zinc-cadmium efflux system membrane fusion protein|nr:efflux RND transporter periplasmic adaptor subunit [Terriglobales bacterium]
MKRAAATNLALSLAALLLLAGCSGDASKNAAAEAPPPAQVEHEGDASLVQVDHAAQFPLATAIEYKAAPQLTATGVVTPDISRTVPVISIASGRVVEIRARLGDTVKKGQLLLRVQSADISGAYSDYRKAVADELLANTQFERAKGLYDHGAISLNDFQVAEDTENKAKVDVETTAEHLRVLGAPLDHPSGIVDIVAPVAGVITDQQVTNAAGVQGLSSTNPFTISDLTSVWILCDVYENDLSDVRLGDSADVRLNAYPDQVVSGRISNIGAVLDPNIRTAKVRIEVKNPGLMRPGMFVTATFRGQKKASHAAVPASAILHLHDRDWVYFPAATNKFKRVPVVAGAMLPNNMQEVTSGIKPGDQVVSNALELQNSSEQ